MARGMLNWTTVGVTMLRRLTREARRVSILASSLNRGPVSRGTMVLSALVIAALLLPFAGAQGPSAPLKIGGDVKAPKVINKVEPKYTEEARAAKISGSVKLRV